MMRLRPYLNRGQSLAPCLIAMALLGCGSVPQSRAPVADSAPIRQAAPVAKSTQITPALPPAGSGRGGYYQDDGPGEAPPEGLQAIPDAEPRIEPYSIKGNRPY